MLTYKNRFHGHGSVRFLYKNGQSVRSSQITIRYIVNPRRKNSRFTVVISKKVVKSAVKRNRIRRRIYEFIRLELPKLKSNHDVAVMIFSSEVLNTEHQELYSQMRQLFTQCGLYK